MNGPLDITSGSATNSRWQRRLYAASVHFGFSCAVAALAAALVFLAWYPSPFREVSGGRELFWLVVVIDVLVGPLLTFVVFDSKKPSIELRRDLAVVLFLQLVALGYGLHTVALARPVVIALEGDRLRVVRAVDLAAADMRRAPAELQSLSWWGPTFVATRQPNTDEKFEAIQRGLAGEDIGMRPEFWLPDGERGAAYARAAESLDRLTAMAGKRAEELPRAIEATGLPPYQLGYLPILARSTDWSALVDRKSGSIVGYVPIDSL